MNNSCCPWCGAEIVVASLSDHVDWGCGSLKHGREPWQAPECRISELEAALERAEAENRRLREALARLIPVACNSATLWDDKWPAIREAEQALAGSDNERGD